MSRDFKTKREDLSKKREKTWNNIIIIMLMRVLSVLSANKVSNVGM